VFYGWLIVGVAFTTQFMAAGLVYYTFGVALKHLTAEFGVGRFGISGIQLVMPWTTALMALVLGRLAGAGHLRALLVAGAIAIGVGFCLISQARALWQLYLIYPVLMAFGTYCLSGVGPATLVVNWFSHRRATALGISQVGAAAGGMIMGPVAASLFAEHGWREVYLGFGVAILAVTPILGWLAVGRPEARGQRPYGAEALPVDVEPPPASPALPTTQALRETNLWLIAIVGGVGTMLSSAMVTHVVAFATDRGMEALQASGLLSVLAFGTVAGKLLFGVLSDRLGERTAYALSIAAEVFALVALAAAEPSGSALYGVMVIFGLGIGGNLPLNAALLTRAFGPAAFGPMMGIKSLLATPIMAAGTPFAGWIYDVSGSYVTAFAVFAALGVVSLFALWAVRLPDTPAG
jgi:MFS family permease